jgi:hypothetical protein
MLRVIFLKGAKLMTDDLFERALALYPNLRFLEISGSKLISNITLTETILANPQLMVQLEGTVYTHPDLAVSEIVEVYKQLKLAKLVEGHHVVTVEPPCSAQKNLLDLEEKILLKILEFVHPMELHQSVALVRVFFNSIMWWHGVIGC